MFDGWVKNWTAVQTDILICFQPEPQKTAWLKFLSTRILFTYRTENRQLLSYPWYTCDKLNTVREEMCSTFIKWSTSPCPVLLIHSHANSLSEHRDHSSMLYQGMALSKSGGNRENLPKEMGKVPHRYTFYWPNSLSQ